MTVAVAGLLASFFKRNSSGQVIVSALQDAGAPYPVGGFDTTSYQHANGLRPNPTTTPTTTYYLDADSGDDGDNGMTTGTAKATWAGVQALLTDGVGGVKIVVIDGTDPGPVSWSSLGGSADTPTGLIEMCPQTPGGVTLTGNGVQFSVVEIRSAQCLWIHGFKIDASSTNGGHCIDGEDSHTIHVTDNECYNGKFGGISFAGSELINIGNNVIYDSSTTDFGSNISIYQPIWIGPSKPGYRNLIHNNASYNATYGAGTDSDNNGIILDDFQRWQGDGGDIQYLGATLVAGNLCVDNDGMGLKILWCGAAPIDVYFNSTWKNTRRNRTGQTWDADGTLRSSPGTRWYGNIHLADSDGGDPHATAFQITSTESGDDVVNTGAEIEYNVFFDDGSSAQHLRVEGASSPTPTDPTNVIGSDPLFTTPATTPGSWDFSLQGGSPARDLVVIPMDPVVLDDVTTAVAGGSSITIDVLANDTFSGVKSGVTVTVVDDYAAGTATVDGNNDITYTPPGSAQTDVIYYKIEDGEGRAGYAKVIIDVQEPPGDALAVLMNSATPDLIGYWRHGDTAGTGTLSDSSSSADHATITGTMTFGVDPELATPTNLQRAVTYNEASASAAVSTEAAVTHGVRFKPTQADIDNEHALLSRNASGNNQGNWFARLAAGGGFRFGAQDGTNPQVNLEAPAGTIVAEQWYEAWWRMSGTGAELFVNAELVDSDASFTNGETGNSLPLLFGAVNFSATNFQGTMHEVKRYDGRVPDAEIVARSFYDSGDPLGSTELPAYTRLVSVANRTELNAAIADLTAGDRVLLTGTDYTGSISAISVDGTAGAPIQFVADTIGDPEFDSLVQIDAAWIYWYGMKHTNTRMTVGGSSASPNCKIWRNLFQNRASQAQTIDCRNAANVDIAFNKIINCLGTGIYCSHNNGCVDATIRYNWLVDPPMVSPKANGTEAFRQQGLRGISARMLFYRNLMQNWNTDAELAKTSSSDNTFRQNRAEGCTAHFSNRGGQDNLWEANVCVNSWGFRTHDARNKWFGNTATGGVLGEDFRICSGTGLEEIEGSTVSHNRSKGTQVSGNTGRLTVGYEYTTHTTPADGTVIYAHTGAITTDNETNTTNNSGSSDPSNTWLSTIVLTTAHVGPAGTGYSA
jgi:hypothetical protein